MYEISNKITLQSPFLDDNEELRLRPVSVNTYVYILPTHHNEDGIFIKCLIESTSELATEVCSFVILTRLECFIIFIYRNTLLFSVPALVIVALKL